MRISKSPLAKLRGKPVPIVVSLSTLPMQTAHMTISRWKAEAPLGRGGDRNPGSLPPRPVVRALVPWRGLCVLGPLLLKPPLLGSVAGCFLLRGWAPMWQGPWSPPAPASRERRPGCSWWKRGLHSLVQEEQLLMTFREKLMMRTASWHFRSGSQQPRGPPKEQRAGAGGPQKLILLCQ